MEDLGPIVGQFLVQLVYAGMYLITRKALNDGMSTFVYVTYRHFIATIVITPFAFFIDRNTRPPLTIKTFLQLNLLGLIGITINQNLYFTGLADTSSTFVSTLNNLIPAITFVIAFLLRLETLDIKSIRGNAKILGTCSCVGGAMIMTLVKGPALKFLKFHKPQAPLFLILDEVVMSGLSHSTWFWGSIFVFLSTICWSSWMILQVWVVRDYPPQLSLTAWMCFLATIQSAVIAVIWAEHSAWKVAWNMQLLSYVYSITKAYVAFIFFRNVHVLEAQRMQMEVQRRFYEQLEVQIHLQLRIEAQRKYMQTILENACQTLGEPSPSKSFKNCGNHQGVLDMGLGSPINMPSLQDLHLYGGDQIDMHHQHMERTLEGFLPSTNDKRPNPYGCSGKNPMIWGDELRMQELGTSGAACSGSQDGDQFHSGVSGMDNTSDLDSIADVYDIKPILDSGKRSDVSSKLERPSPRISSLQNDRITPMIKGGGFSNSRNFSYG